LGVRSALVVAARSTHPREREKAADASQDRSMATMMGAALDRFSLTAA